MNLSRLLIGILSLHLYEISGDVQDDLAPVDGEIQGSSKCARVNGCKTVQTEFCTGPSGTIQCHACFYEGGKETGTRNLFRADFYEAVKDHDLMEQLKGCTTQTCPFPHANEMAQYMLLKDDRVARSAQGSIYQHFNIPDDALYPDIARSYTTHFCDTQCVLAMKAACFGATLITHVRNWCLDVLEWVQDEIPNLRGPASFIAYLAAKATYFGSQYQLIPKAGSWPGLQWPNGKNFYPSTDERAVVVAAAAASILLAGHWWDHIDPLKIKDFGYAVQHSLFIAIYAGRLRISVQPHTIQASYVPGTTAFCSSDISSNAAPNFSGVTGNVFATICTAFGPRNTRKKLRYRPEIHGRNDEGCVERTAGMAFIMPGDWITPTYSHSTIGSIKNPDGITFRTTSGNTPLELYSSGIAQIFAPSVAVDLEKSDETACTGDKGKGNGSNLQGALAAAGIEGVGGICNWVASW